MGGVRMYVDTDGLASLRGLYYKGAEPGVRQ